MENRDRILSLEQPHLIWVGASVPTLPSTWRVSRVESAQEAFDLYPDPAPHAIVIEAHVCADEFVAEMRQIAPVIVIGDILSIADTVRLMRVGAHEVALPDQAIEAIESALEWQHTRLASVTRNEEPWRKSLLGTSRAFDHTLEIIRLAGARKATVLITGETGTGKEMAARALHLAGPRASA